MYYKIKFTLKIRGITSLTIVDIERLIKCDRAELVAHRLRNIRKYIVKIAGRCIPILGAAVALQAAVDVDGAIYGFNYIAEVDILRGSVELITSLHSFIGNHNLADHKLPQDLEGKPKGNRSSLRYASCIHPFLILRKAADNPYRIIGLLGDAHFNISLIP